MTYIEACPKCSCEDYEINDYGDGFDTYSGAQWWTCTCNNCGCVFDITKNYKLVDVTIEEVSAG